jgi:hypothetical protein
VAVRVGRTEGAPLLGDHLDVAPKRGYRERVKGDEPAPASDLPSSP